MKCELLLEKNSRTYVGREDVKGHVQVDNPPNGLAFNFLQVVLEGYIKGQVSMKSVGALDDILPQVPPVIISRQAQTIANKGNFVPGKTLFPFSIPIIPDGGQVLLETYTGVYISIQYEIKASFNVSENKNKVATPVPIKIMVHVPGLGLIDGISRNPQVQPFIITPNSIANPNKITSLPEFRVEGELASSVFELDREFSGWLTIVEATKPIKSIDLQLIRIESIFSGETGFKEPTEVQSLQIADGDVRKGAKIPLYMLFPRQFTCPTTFYNKFKIEFEVNLSILFFDGYQLTKNFPIYLIR
jgi:Vacuolar protein sorting-associated protein 26